MSSGEWGTDSFFWTDIRIGECRFKTYFPNLFMICIGTGITLQEAGA